MKRYLLQLSDTSWLSLINRWRELNDLRRKQKLPFIHKATLIRIAIEDLLLLSTSELSARIDRDNIS